ncbi:MAG: carboxymuconolactone decarboxylase family protein [Acidimicrobiales bacterium]|nr:carboxymuconolactone decarboxylase family protein [Acidimicrobiales bacterium]MCB1261940.1 carboxymuconolactone decarboxylase family protein [Acidimicrobiales bacterium]
MSEQEWSFSYEGPLHEVFPALQEAQSAYLGQIESLQALDRRTHELIRLAVAVIARNRGGVERHARLATEVGATWEEVVAAMVLTQPSFGLLPTAEALPAARAGFEAGASQPDADE